MMTTGLPSSFTSDAAQNTAARRPFAATPPVSPMPTPRAPSALRRAARKEEAAEDVEVEVIVKADMVSEDR